MSRRHFTQGIFTAAWIAVVFVAGAYLGDRVGLLPLLSDPDGVEGMWHPVTAKLADTRLLVPNDSGGLPDGERIREFLASIEQLALSSRRVGSISINNLQFDIRSRWVSVSFQTRGRGTRWSVQGQLITPDVFRSRGGLEFVPRYVSTPSNVSGSAPSVESVRRNYDALKEALEILARQAAVDDLAEFRPQDV